MLNHAFFLMIHMITAIKDSLKRQNRLMILVFSVIIVHLIQRIRFVQGILLKTFGLKLGVRTEGLL